MAIELPTQAPPPLLQQNSRGVNNLVHLENQGTSENGRNKNTSWKDSANQLFGIADANQGHDHKSSKKGKAHSPGQKEPNQTDCDRNMGITAAKRASAPDNVSSAHTRILRTPQSIGNASFTCAWKETEEVILPNVLP